jgi:hypothetical protein
MDIIAAATGANGDDRHAEGTPHPGSHRRAARQGGGGAHNYQPDHCGEHTRTSITGDVISHASGSRRDEACNVGRNDKRYRHHQPASFHEKLSGTYPYSSKQSNPALLRAIRLQLRCNLELRRNVRTRFFHRICMPAGPMERAPV